MTHAWLTLALAATSAWSDPSGRLRCEVPDGYAATVAEPWHFTRADGLRQLVFMTVKPVSDGPTVRARQLLGQVGATDVTTDDPPRGALPGTPMLAASFAVAKVEPTWAGVLVLGAATVDVAAEAKQLAGQCRTVTPAAANGRVYDATRRLSAEVPQGLVAIEVRGAGAVQGAGFTVRMTSVQPKTKASLADIAAEWLAASGAKQSGLEGASAGTGDLPVVVANGAQLQGGAEFFIEIAVIDLGNGEVGGIGLSASAAAQPRARGALDDMLRTIAVSGATAAPK